MRLPSHFKHGTIEVPFYDRGSPGRDRFAGRGCQRTTPRITILGLLASADAYHAHLESPHFKKYKAGTLEMVPSLELGEVNPITVGGKVK